MPEPAFLVEGHMEQNIIRTLCPGKIVRRIGCNGDKVSMVTLSKFLHVQIQLLKNSHPVVIVFDRERRGESCEILQSQLSSCLNSLGHTGKYIIGIADRTIENWILADWDSVLSMRPTYKILANSSEQKHGKAQLKKLLPKGQFYNEATLGTELFCLTKSKGIYLNSPSFASFVDSISFECGWLTQ